tara:strand:- start:90 stop:533 length:444 start_codon:yes stop_codon:yes gene_type:complete
MAKNIFEHLGDITHKKTDVDTYTESDWKSYTPYMINRWLSMNPAAIDIVNIVQKHYSLSKKMHYKLYSDIFPKQKLYTRYIKAPKNTKYTPELISIISSHFEISKSETKEYLDLFFSDNLRILELKNILKKYGHTDKDIKKLIKVKR